MVQEEREDRRFRNMREWKIRLPLRDEDIESLRAGDYVYLSGDLYVARDAAHRRLTELIEAGQDLPIALAGETIYYMGPSPAREGRVIGSAGPTTAGRMDQYTPRLLDLGLKGMVGKGRRSREVIDAIVRNHAIYLAAVGGAGALLSKHISRSEIVCYEDLGAEAIRRIRVEDFPLVLIVDCKGNDLYAAVGQKHVDKAKRLD